MPDLPCSFFSNNLPTCAKYGFRASCSKQAKLIELSPISGSADVSVKWMHTGVEIVNSLSGTILKYSCSKISSIVQLPEKISCRSEIRLGERSL